MKIFTIESVPEIDESSYVCGVYSSLEKALSQIRKLPVRGSDPFDYQVQSKYRIHEYETDLEMNI